MTLLPVETQETHVKISSNTSLQAEIKTHDVTNAKREYWQYTNIMIG
jgi:hypothetical protein